jgi:MYXO-CTERM domain-containing protein
LIGTSGHTCWAEVDTNTNFVYRADVTARVAGNADYELADFPSGATGADSQGASLVVVYQDPADPLVGDVVLYDGAITVNQTSAVEQSFESLTIPPVVQSAIFRVGVGDGQETFVDGPLFFKGVDLPQPDGIQYYKSTSGLYWDVVAWDVTSRLKPSDKIIKWTQEYMQDCLVFAFSQLEVHRDVIDDDGDDVDDGFDNCVGTANANQADSDDDGVGDACDEQGAGGAGSGGGEPGSGGVPSSAGGSSLEGGVTGDGDGAMVGDGGRATTGDGGETAAITGGQSDGASTSDARSSDPSGCGCRTQGNGGGNGAYVGLLLAVLGLRRRLAA